MPGTTDSARRDLLKPAVFAACLVPALWYGVAAAADLLGANPIEALNRGLGDWALRFLLLALAVTPASRLSPLRGVARLRRMIGLFAFFYVCLHLASYVVLDQFFDWPAIWKDILKRRYITVGVIVFVLLVPLAATSTNAMVKRLGGKRWRALHRLVYPAAILAVVHFFMMVKADIREPLVYGVILAGLLGYRLAARFRRRRRPRSLKQA